MVIPAGKTVMLDVDTPVLKMLLIQGRVKCGNCSQTNASFMKMVSKIDLY